MKKAANLTQKVGKNLILFLKYIFHVLSKYDKVRNYKMLGRVFIPMKWRAKMDPPSNAFISYLQQAT